MKKTLILVVACAILGVGLGVGSVKAAKKFWLTKRPCGCSDKKNAARVAAEDQAKWAQWANGSTNK